MIDHIRIGTRESKLALWQAMQVSGYLNPQHNNELILIKSEGDINLVTPLYELGVQGIFTKALDIALLEHRVDIAVHSYKDVPTQLAAGLQVAAVLKRGNPFDVMVCKNEMSAENFNQPDGMFSIATSSIRRRAQWLSRYPNYQIENLRGNVQTRLQKLQTSEWQGAIFAAAGLERLGLTEKETGPQIVLDWMLPAPAQGAVVIVCRKGDEQILEICAGINDEATAICTGVERDFLRILQGGCSTPIGAFAKMEEDDITLTCNITATDGSEVVSLTITENVANVALLAHNAAKVIIEKGGKALLHK